MKTLLLVAAIFGSPVWAETASDWRIQHSQSLAELTQHPQFSFYWDAKPSPTRAGMLRFLGDQFVNPEWTPVYIARFEDSQTPQEVRYALIDVIGRSGGDFTSAILNLWLKEADPKARALMLDLVKRMDAEDARKLFEMAHQDRHPIVQEAFYRNLPRQDTVIEESWVLDGLQSDSLEALEMAIRTAGWLKIDSAFQPLQIFLQSSSPTIRLRTLRALERIDSTSTAQLKAVELLTQDADPKVSRAALQIITP